MMTYNPVANKLVQTSRPIKIGYLRVFPIPKGKFSKKEIDELRKYDETVKRLGYHPFVANFLPDDIRPKGIPKL